MPTENWYPISNATHDLPASTDDWTLGAGANKNVACQVGGGRAGPATHDDSSSYISRGTTTGNQALNIDWPGPMASYDGVLTANYRDATNGTAVTRSMVMISSGAAGTAFLSVNNNSGIYVDHGPQDISVAATYRPGGGSWQVSDFADDKTIFVRMSQDGGTGTVFVTSVWGTISFTPTSGGFAFLLGVAGLLPVLGALTDMGHFTRYLAWRRRFHPRHTILTGAEVEQAWREIRAYRHPRFFFPAVA